MGVADNDNDLRRIQLLERTLQEIVQLSWNHPDNVELRYARTLTLGALDAPTADTL